MNKIIMAALAATVAVGGISAAQAADGCGPGGHRGYHGNCRPNRGGDAVVVAPGLVVGTYYHGHGYWDGHRYYQHRERWHNGWRYR
jgi:hypothetical protein